MTAPRRSEALTKKSAGSRFVKAVLGLTAVALCGQQAVAQNYKFRTIDINQQDQTKLLAVASGTILGWDIPASGNQICDLIQGKTITPISDPNGTVTYCYGINPAGTIVGYYENSNNTAVGFTYSGGTWTDFSLPNGAPGPLPLAISPSGLITGYYYQNSEPFGFVLKGKKVTTFQIAGMTNIFPDGINNAGEVSIQAMDGSGNLHCFMKVGAGFTELTYPGATTTVCNGIDRTGLIVGHYIDAASNEHGFVYDPSNSSYTTIDVPGAAATSILGTDSDGRTLVGLYRSTANGPDQGLKAVGSPP
jgi:hypothetical protein